MSIIISGVDVNQIIYSYLLEMNYTHSAFSFQNEASLEPAQIQQRRIPPQYLYTLFEKALVLKNMEEHISLDENQQCEEDYELLKPHKCAIVQRNYLSRRNVIRQINEQTEQLMAESQKQFSQRAPVSISGATHRPSGNDKSQKKGGFFNDLSTQAAIPNLSHSRSVQPNTSTQNQQKNQKKSEIQAFESNHQNFQGETSSAVKDHANFSQNPFGGPNSGPVNFQNFSNFSQQMQQFPMMNNGAKLNNEIGNGLGAQHLDKIKIEFTKLKDHLNLKNTQIKQTFNNQRTQLSYCLIQNDHVSEEKGSSKVFSIQEICDQEVSVKFVLPADKLSGQTSLFLKKHLFIFDQTSLELIVLHYVKIMVVTKMTLKGQLKNVDHNHLTSSYYLTFQDRITVLDDFKFTVKEEIQGQFGDISFGQDGSFCLLDVGKNLIQLRKPGLLIRELVYPDMDSILTGVKINSNGIFIVARYDNPYCIVVFTMTKEEYIFTFNENKQFQEFLATGSDQMLNNCVVCYDQDYLKIWDTNYGNLKQNIDSSRKKVEEVYEINEGQAILIRYESGDLKMFDFLSKTQKTMYTAEENSQLMKLDQNQFLIVQQNEGLGLLTVQKKK